MTVNAAGVLPEDGKELVCRPMVAQSSRRRWRGFVAGSIMAAFLYAFLAFECLPRPWGLAVPALLVFVVPSSPHLSRRVSLNGSVALGWTPLSWMLGLPFQINHGALLCATAAGVFTARLASAPLLSPELRGLVPKVRRADLLILVSAVLGIGTVQSWMKPSTPRQALAVLLPGYDNSSHFDMFRMIRIHGVTLDHLGVSPDGTGWSFGDYPQGYHTVIASMAELASPHSQSAGADLLLFVHVAAVAVVSAIVLLVSAVCAIDALSQRMVVMIPVAALILTAFLWAPGAGVLADGFANFWFAAAASATALLLCLTNSRARSLPSFAAVAGLIFVASSTWLPLGALVTPAAILLIPLGDSAKSVPLRVKWGFASFFLASAGGLVKSLIAAASAVNVSTLVEATGQARGTAPLPLLLLVVVTTGICLRIQGLSDRGVNLGIDLAVLPRVRYLACTSLGGFAVLAALLVMQLRSIGTTSYYFLKLMVGFELVIVPLAAALIGIVVASRRLESRDTRFRATAIAGAAVVLATQFFGHVPWSSAPMLTSTRYGNDIHGRPIALDAMAAAILDASKPTDQIAFRSEYVALGRGRGYDAILPAAWFHALSGNFTGLAQERMSQLTVHVTDANDAAPLVAKILQGHPRTNVIVSSEFVGSLRALVPRDLRRRITSTP